MHREHMKVECVISLKHTFHIFLFSLFFPLPLFPIVPFIFLLFIYLNIFSVVHLACSFMILSWLVLEVFSFTLQGKSRKK